MLNFASSTVYIPQGFILHSLRLPPIGLSPSNPAYIVSSYTQNQTRIKVHLLVLSPNSYEVRVTHSLSCREKPTTTTVGDIERMIARWLVRISSSFCYESVRLASDDSHIRNEQSIQVVGNAPSCLACDSCISPFSSRLSYLSTYDSCVWRKSRLLPGCHFGSAGPTL